MFVSPTQLVRTPAHLVQVLGQWHVQSQRIARRNALTASTLLAERRRELDEVEQYLAARSATLPAARTRSDSAGDGVLARNRRA